MKNILIIGEKFSSNLGDGVICDTVIGLLSKKNYNISVLDLSGRTFYENESNSFSIYKEYKTYIRSFIKRFLYLFGYKKMGKNLFNIFNKFKKQFDILVEKNDFDFIVFAGGQLFIDTFINQISYVCKYCERNNIKIIFNSCGLGKVHNKNALINVLNSDSVVYISMRNGNNNLAKYTNKNYCVCCDNAVYCSKIYGYKNNKNNLYGIGMMFSIFHSPLKQIIFWKKFIKQLVNEKMNFKIFTNGSYKDYSFAKFILNLANLNIDYYLCERPEIPQQLVDQITSFEKIVSMRLHSMIVAYSYDIPTLAICWDTKVSAFFSKIKLEDNCYTLNSKSKRIISHLRKMDANTINQLLKKEILSEVDNNIEKIQKIIDAKI